MTHECWIEVQFDEIVTDIETAINGNEILAQASLQWKWKSSIAKNGKPG